MKKLTYIIALAVLLIGFNQTSFAQTADTPVVSMASTSSSSSSMEGKKIFGLVGMGAYDINSDFESLYVNFATTNINSASLGFLTFFEFGFSDRFAGEISLGYSRLIYSNKFRSVIKENYFVGDILAHYYFLNEEKIKPYVIFGGGAIASSGGVAPVIDAGIGMHYMLNDEFSLKADLIIKSAIIYNRGETRFGISYHF